MTSVRLAPGPERNGLAADHLVGASTTSTSGSSRLLGEGVPRALQQQDVAGREGDLVRAEVLALALDGEHHQVAALGDHPGERRLPDQAAERGRTMTSATPDFRVNRSAAVIVVEVVAARAGSRACSLKSAGM